MHCEYFHRILKIHLRDVTVILKLEGGAGGQQACTRLSERCGSFPRLSMWWKPVKLAPKAMLLNRIDTSLITSVFIVLHPPKAGPLHHTPKAH